MPTVGFFVFLVLAVANLVAYFVGMIDVHVCGLSVSQSHVNPESVKRGSPSRSKWRSISKVCLPLST